MVTSRSLLPVTPMSLGDSMTTKSHPGTNWLKSHLLQPVSPYIVCLWPWIMINYPRILINLSEGPCTPKVALGSRTLESAQSTADPAAAKNKGKPFPPLPEPKVCSACAAVGKRVMLVCIFSSTSSNYFCTPMSDAELSHLLFLDQGIIISCTKWWAPQHGKFNKALMSPTTNTRHLKKTRPNLQCY